MKYLTLFQEQIEEENAVLDTKDYVFMKMMHLKRMACGIYCL